VRRFNLAFCAPHYVEWFEEQVRRTLQRYRMLRPEDRVLVAVSGGKDSLALWEVLSRLGYETAGLHIQLGIGEYSRRSREVTERFARERGLPLRVVDLHETYGLGVPDLARLLNRVPCSGCGLSKRYLINRIAHEEGFTAVATGHNLDDESATMLGNLLHWQMDALPRQSPVLEAGEGLVRRVKPLFLMSEKDTATYALLRGIDYIAEECPHAQGALSLVYKDALNRVEWESPGTKYRFLLGFLDRMRALLEAKEAPTLQACRVCGYPTTGEVCAFCRMWETARQRAQRGKGHRAVPAPAGPGLGVLADAEGEAPSPEGASG